MSPPGIFFEASSKVWRAVRDGRWHRLFGRLTPYGGLVAVMRGLADRLVRPPPSSPPTVFPRLSPAAAVEVLRADGVWASLQLPAASVAEIARYAARNPCRLRQGDSELFEIDRVRDGRTPSGRPAPIVQVAAAEPCPAIEAIAADPLLLETARRYLGFRPRRMERRLYWSPLGCLSDEARRAGGQTVDFHYDIEVGRGLYAFFYIIGGDRHSGAHVAVAGTHRGKPLRLALAPAFQSDAAVFASFDRSRQRVMEGGPGFGFLEDPACYHKVLPPSRGPRLVLQLRMF